MAAANILARPLLEGAVSDRQLRQVQRRRRYPTRMTQLFQVLAQKRMLGPALKNKNPVRKLPLPFRLLQWLPTLRRIPARLIGIGFRPEHIRTPDYAKPSE